MFRYLPLVAFLLMMVLNLSKGFSQHKVTYQVFQKNGKKSNYGKMIRNLDDARVVLFGEIHNSPIAHWLEIEMIKSLQENTNLVVGAEMFDRSQQTAINKFLDSLVSISQLDSMENLWPNFQTDYAPILAYLQKHSIPLVATNIPRQYSRMVYLNGFQSLDTLTSASKSLIAPLPIDFDPELPGYKNIGRMAHGHQTENLAKAQAIKDATMAHFIIENLPDDGLFFHINGMYHSNNFEGIYWYLKNKQPDLKIVTISTVWQQELGDLQAQNQGLADYIIAIDEDVTRSY